MTAVDFAAFVERLAQVSGEVILPFFRSAIRADDKSLGGAFDPVTEADRGAEAAMRRLIAQTFPAHGVIGEEYGRDRPEAEYVWVLDPIDGTKSFVSGLPTWGTLIGLMHRGQPVYGMMAQPFTRERFHGDGKRAKLRTLAPSRGEAPPSEWATRALRVRPRASLREATLMTTSPLLIRDPADRAGLAECLQLFWDAVADPLALAALADARRGEPDKDQLADLALTPEQQERYPLIAELWKYERGTPDDGFEIGFAALIAGLRTLAPG